MAALKPRVEVPVKPHVFEAMQSVDMDTLGKCSETELRPVLPGLVRMALCSPLDSSEQGSKLRKTALIYLSALEVVNNIVGLLSIDFHSLEQDVKKEQQLRWLSPYLSLSLSRFGYTTLIVETCVKE